MVGGTINVGEKHAWPLFCWIWFPDSSTYIEPWSSTLTVRFSFKQINFFYTSFWATVDLFTTPTFWCPMWPEPFPCGWAVILRITSQEPIILLNQQQAQSLMKLASLILECWFHQRLNHFSKASTAWDPGVGTVDFSGTTDIFLIKQLARKRVPEEFYRNNLVRIGSCLVVKKVVP